MEKCDGGEGVVHNLFAIATNNRRWSTTRTALLLCGVNMKGPGFDFTAK